MKLAKDIMNTNVITLPQNETIAKAVAKMDQYDIKEIPVTNDNGEFVGIISYYDILDSPKIDADAKISTMIVKPPTASPQTPISEIARLIINSGIEAVPILENKKVVGIISDYDILNQSLNDKRLKSLKISELMRTPPKFLHGDEPISTARRIMRFYNIDRLPVVTEDGRPLGMILSMDILRTFYRHPTERIGSKDVVGRKINPLDIPVKGIMRTDIPEVYLNESASSVAQKMLERHLRGLQVLDEQGRVVGIVHRLDILDRLVEKKFHDGVWLNFSGAELPYDQVEAVKDYIATDIKRLKYYLPNLTSVDIRVKKIHGASPNKWNYEVNVTLTKSAGPKESIRTLYGYNLMFTAKEALEKLIKQLERRYKKRAGKTYG